MEAMFESFTCAEDYEEAGVKFLSPMLAKELVEEEKQDNCLNSPDYIIEEKFDGTRALLHFYPEFNRCFSRRVSEKTGWFCENSDSLPHIRDHVVPELAGTIIDGEMFISGRPFKDVSSTLNCKWDKAVERQEELGKIVLHAFDILYYKGIKVMNMPLYRRKVYLQKVIDAFDSPYVVMVDYQSCGTRKDRGNKIIDSTPYIQSHGEVYDVYKSLSTKNKERAYSSYPHFMQEAPYDYKLSPRGFYEYIVATGGEGVIVKPKDGRYHDDYRGWEYSKIKKFLTREVIIMGFTEPTEEYKGKFPTIEKWDYWETVEHDIVDLSCFNEKDREQFKRNFYPDECTPVSKFYAKNWVGNVRFGVIIAPEEEAKLPKNKKFNIEDMTFLDYKHEGRKRVIEVGECGGFDEEVREYMTDNQTKLKGAVIEVKANELFKDTGKMRHPRFLRFREDKSPLECTWKEHLDV